jgi:ABC-2 type transport system ATP-binding protein
MTDIVQIQDLIKVYPGASTPSVAGISFGIKQGELFSLLGPNGAGKTTTISILSCLLEPTSGEASVAGHSVRREPLAVKRVIGVVPQEIALYPTLSARENLRFWGNMYGLSGSDLRKRVDELLEVVGLSDHAKQRIETFSGGMKRRINIAVGLLHKPQVVFMDEPTVGIDPQSRRKILDMVLGLNAQGMTVLYTTHYMEEAQELSQRIGIMDQGKLIALGTLAELTRLVGEQDVLLLHTSGDECAPDLVADLATVNGVTKVTAKGGTLRILAADGNAALPQLVLAANARGVRFTGVEIQEPNLEAVFLHLTGRALRD